MFAYVLEDHEPSSLHLNGSPGYEVAMSHECTNSCRSSEITTLKDHHQTNDKLQTYWEYKSDQVLW